MTHRERNAFALGYPLEDLLAVSRTVTGPERDRDAFEDRQHELELTLAAGSITPEEFATEIREAAKAHGI